MADSMGNWQCMETDSECLSTALPKTRCQKSQCVFDSRSLLSTTDLISYISYLVLKLSEYRCWNECTTISSSMFGMAHLLFPASSISWLSIASKTGELSANTCLCTFSSSREFKVTEESVKHWLQFTFGCVVDYEWEAMTFRLKQKVVYRSELS